jgi:hypothetical protein
MSEPRPIAPSAVISRAPEQVSTTIADEIVLLGLRTSRYFGLDGVGADVWRWLAEPTSFEALVGNVLEHYAVDRGPAESDLTEFLRELEAEGLIDIGGAA